MHPVPQCFADTAPWDENKGPNDDPGGAAKEILGHSKEQESATAFYEMASRCSQLQDGLAYLMPLVLHRTLLTPIPFLVAPSLHQRIGAQLPCEYV